jgi:sugar phosphate isomerase/epimerase
MTSDRPTPPRLSRREWLAAGSALAFAADHHGRAAPNDAPGAKRSTLGLVMYCCQLRRNQDLRRDASADLFDPLRFLQHCHDLGFGGMQLALGHLDRQRITTLREFADRHGLFIEGIVQPPRDAADANRFEAEIATAAAVGAKVVRTVVIPGRRYEQFRSLREFREAAEQAEAMLRRAKPIVERHQVRLAVENHKDQRIDERLALYQRLGSEYIGACVDTGNNLALIEDPDAVVEALAPYAFTVHLKDQAVRETDEGFLLGDIPLGEGGLNLPRMVQTLRNAQPTLRFHLELITRDALRVPCLTSEFWVTMPTVPAADLARTLRHVRATASSQLQTVSSLDPASQRRLEDDNIRRSRTYAQEHLGF